jgi:hypothetical protein
LEAIKNMLRTKTMELVDKKPVSKKAKEDLDSRNEKLEGAKKEATTAQDQLKSILDQLRKAKVARARKWQAEDDMPVSRTKRVKTEPED